MSLTPEEEASPRYKEALARYTEAGVQFPDTLARIEIKAGRPVQVTTFRRVLDGWERRTLDASGVLSVEGIPVKPELGLPKKKKAAPEAEGQGSMFA